jgi:hypothetical protein
VFSNVSNDQLTQIQDILQQLDRAPVTNADANRRRAERLKIRSEMAVIVLAATGLPSIKIFSRNLSKSGIGFISRRPFNKEERVAVSFELPGQPAKLVLARTTFSRYVRGGVYEMGAEFIECITDTKGADRIPAHWLPSAAHPKPSMAAAKA